MERNNDEKEDLEQSFINVGMKSLNESTELTGSVTPKDDKTTDMADSGVEGGNKDSLLSNIKFLYEQNTDRCRKRAAQMKKIRGGTTYSEESSSPEKKRKCTTPSIYNTNNNQLTTECSPSKSKVTLETEESKLANTQNLVGNEESDMDRSVEIKGDIVEQSPHSHKSFVPLANNLVSLNSVREDNITPSYFLALNQCSDIIAGYERFNNNKISLTDEEKYKNPYSQQNHVNATKHFRLPSGKNYLINSMIEEEVNETYTDSEISNKTRPLLFSTKNFTGAFHTKKISLIKTSRDLMSDKTSDNSFYNKIRKFSTQLDNNTIKSLKQSHESSNFLEEQNQIGHKTAKSQVFNMHNSLKKMIDEIVHKKQKEKESIKSKLDMKKLELKNIDKYFNKNNIQNINKISSPNFFLNQMLNKNNSKKYFINTGSENSNAMPLKSPGFITSHSEKSTKDQKEKFLLELSEHCKKMITLEEYDVPKVTKLTKEDFEVKYFSPFKKEFSTISSEFKTVGTNNENKKTIHSSINFSRIKDKYKTDRRKLSSLFKSEDLRICTKTENTIKNLFLSPKNQIAYSGNNSKPEKDKRISLDLFRSKVGIPSGPHHKKTMSVNANMGNILNLNKNESGKKSNFNHFLSYKGNYMLSNNEGRPAAMSAKYSKIENNSIFQAHNLKNSNNQVGEKIQEKVEKTNSTNNFRNKIKITPSFIRLFSNGPNFTKPKQASTLELKQIIHLSRNEDGEKSKNASTPNISSNSISNSNNTTSITTNNQNLGSKKSLPLFYK